jgi:DNA-binding NarL/FixJ family response regulator
MKPAAPKQGSKSMLNDYSQGSAGDDQTWRTSVGSKHEARPVHLTPREREVLALMCEGLSNKAIARRLGIAPTTIKVHVSKILRTLNVSNRLNAVLRTRSWGLLEQSINHDDQRHPAWHGRHR